MVTAQDVLKDVREGDVRWVNLQFVDLDGSLRNLTIPSKSVDNETFSHGAPKLDPSGIPGFGGQDELILLPDPETYARIPWDNTSCRIFCSLKVPGTDQHSDLDSRSVAAKTETALAGAGYSSRIGVQLEFFVFDNVTVDALAPQKSQGYALDSREAAWNYYGQNYPIDFQGGYMASTPKDALSVLRSNISDVLEGAFGVSVGSHKHGHASTGHCSIELGPAQLIESADDIVTSKYVIKNVSTATGLIACFMPKPVHLQNGCSMHVHQSLLAGEKNIFFDPGDEACGLSQAARYYVGGILSHAPALCALTNATTNSYKRLLGDGMTCATWGPGDRSVSLRVPTYEKNNENSKRAEYRIPDSACNPYLSLSAIVLAGLDGIKNKIEPGNPVKRSSLAAPKGKPLPRTLWEALDALRSDNSFLKVAFPSALLESYLDVKHKDAMSEAILPTPAEFKRYLGF